jgi:uncharacterized delta-60 repeat protein
MTKSYRIKANPGSDKNIRVQIDQDFDLIEILSLKLKQDEVYTRFCSDYGVIAGRVIANGGYGVPNVSISVFVPLSVEDENDEVISTLYPYKTLSDKNEDGYRYNLLPYVQEYGGHTPTGTFPDREDLLSRTEVLEVYEKYYKFTVRTNESGDFMIVGVPLGQQKVVMDMDLSNIGCFSQRPSDLIRMGLGVEGQFNGSQFRSNTNLAMLPQIINVNKEVEVDAFWGDTNSCTVGITRVDFDLRESGIEISPQGIFMGSIFSNSDEDELKLSCKPSLNTGALCDMIAQAGSIIAIRQTIFSDADGFPVLEEHKFEDGGNIIDDNGTWLVEVPMNLDYVSTNEFGEQILSNDPNIGIPTKGRYRFRVRYQVEDPTGNEVIRADYLVPNIKEYGWSSGSQNEPDDLTLQEKSYAFSLDWSDYGDPTTLLGRQIIQEAIDCKDKFFELNYNRVYTVSGHIDRWKWGYLPNRVLGIKEITERACTATTNRFPTNDAQFRFDLIFFVVYFVISIFYPLIYVFIVTLHVLAWLYDIVVKYWNRLANFWNDRIVSLCYQLNDTGLFNLNCDGWLLPLMDPKNPFARYSLPMISYPDCESCSCEVVQVPDDLIEIYRDNGNFSPLINSNSLITYEGYDESFVANQIRNADPNANTDSNYDFTDLSLNSAIRQGLAGYNGDFSGEKYKFFKSPILTWPTQSSASASVMFTAHWSQALNRLNSRQGYYEFNKITTTIKNINPATNVEVPSQPFKDQPLIMVCDEGTLSNMGSPGQLLTFTDINAIQDPNLTGFTLNSFGTNSITGNTAYNLNGLVTRSVNFYEPWYGYQNAQVYLKLTKDKIAYRFKTGLEYFQFVTGGTMEQLEQYINFNNYGPLQQNIYNYGMKGRWGKGIRTTTNVSWGFFPNAIVRTIDEDSLGNVYLGGDFTSYGSNASNRIVRILPSGLIDPSFSIGTGFNGSVRSIKVQSNDKVVVVGDFTTYNGTSSIGRIIRLNSDGTIDLTFNVASNDFNDSCRTVTIQSDGKILVGGEFTSFGAQSANRIIRLSSLGVYDATFNTYIGANKGFNAPVNDISLQSDGNILVAGEFTLYNNNQSARYACRLQTNGLQDTGFYVSSPSPNANDINYYANVIRESLDGFNNVYIGGGFTSYQGTQVGRLIKVNPSGGLIPGFNHYSLGQPITSNFNEEVFGLDVYLDGAGNEKIIVGGVFSSFINQNSQTVNSGQIIRLESNGDVDTNQIVWLAYSTNDAILTVKRLQNTNFMVGGSFSLPSQGLGATQAASTNVKRFLDNGQGLSVQGSALVQPEPAVYNSWRNISRPNYGALPKFYVSNFKNKEIIILTRGVDPYTEKQRIEYDLSELFGQSLGTIKVLGDYYLNIPSQNNMGNLTNTQPWQAPGVTNSQWWNDSNTPESHNVINNRNPKLFFRPYCSPGPSGNLAIFPQASWSAFTNNSIKYYNSTDKSQANHVAYNNDAKNITSFTSPAGVYSPLSYNWSQNTNTVGFNWYVADPPATITPTGFATSVLPQRNIEGSSFVGSSITTGINVDINNTSNFIRVYSPAYHLDNTPNISIDNSSRLVFRSDRLPTSTATQVSGNTSFSLFLNDNFKMYKVSETGLSTELTFTPFTPLNIGVSADFLDRPTGSTVSDLVINSLSCEGMVPLACYSGNGESFGVESPCTDNFEGNPQQQTVIGGCYYFVSKEYLSREQLERDANNLAEWKSRFIFSFAACREIFSHTFHNNWVNGGLYTFGFQKQTIFDENNNPIQKFCGSSFSTNAPYQGPTYYDNVKSSYFYRSTPYSHTENKFVGQLPRKKEWFGGQWVSAADYQGLNERNIFFPTTIMDLGPRDQFTKEICFNPQLDGYLIDTFRSTTFSPTDTILLFFFLSRLLSTTAADKYTGLGNASVLALFSRSGLRIDGDVAQMFSINSEYGTLPFNDQFYDDNDVYLSTTNGDPVIGVLYSANTKNRILLTPGTLTFGNVLQTNGYPSTQVVPTYKWTRNDDNGYVSILGSEKNNWYTGLNGINAYPYQQMSFNSTPYFQATNGSNTGYIFNYTPSGEPTFGPSTNQSGQHFVVGAPYHFYFGLFRGKTAINRYIKKYIISTTL